MAGLTALTPTTPKKGGLDDPTAITSANSDDIKSALMQQIQERQAQLNSRSSRFADAAAFLAPYENLSQSLAQREQVKQGQQADLFSMRQQLANAEQIAQQRKQFASLLGGGGGGAGGPGMGNIAGGNVYGGAGLDPNTQAALLMQYSQDPKKALENLASLGLDNAKLTTEVKNALAAGLNPRDPRFLSKFLGDSDMNQFAAKKLLEQQLGMGSEQFKHGLGLEAEKFKSGLAQNQELFKHGLQTGSFAPGTGGPAGAGNAAFRSVNQSKAFDDYNKELLNEVKTASSANAPLDKILNIVRQYPDLTGTFTGLRAGVLGAKVGAGLGTQAEEDWLTARQEFTANVNKTILPLAKTLGANPSDTDAKRIESTIGNTTTLPKAIAANVIVAKTTNAIAQQKQQFMNANGAKFSDPSQAEAAWLEYKEANKLWPKTEAQIIESFKAQPSKGQSKQQATTQDTRPPLSSFQR